MSTFSDTTQIEQSVGYIDRSLVRNTPTLDFIDRLEVVDGKVIDKVVVMALKDRRDEFEADEELQALLGEKLAKLAVVTGVLEEDRLREYALFHLTRRSGSEKTRLTARNCLNGSRKRKREAAYRFYAEWGVDVEDAAALRLVYEAGKDRQELLELAIRSGTEVISAEVLEQAIREHLEPYWRARGIHKLLLLGSPSSNFSSEFPQETLHAIGRTGDKSFSNDVQNINTPTLELLGWKGWAYAEIGQTNKAQDVRNRLLESLSKID